MARDESGDENGDNGDTEVVYRRPGRPMGSANKRSEEARKYLTDPITGKTPLHVLRELYLDEKVDPAIRERAASHAAAFGWAKLKAIEIIDDREPRKPAAIQQELVDFLTHIADHNPALRRELMDQLLKPVNDAEPADLIGLDE